MADTCWPRDTLSATLNWGCIDAGQGGWGQGLAISERQQQGLSSVSCFSDPRRRTSVSVHRKHWDPPVPQTQKH